MTESRIACLGEAMVELRECPEQPESYCLGYAGDVFNTAVGLADEGLTTAFVSLLGNDRFSDGIVQTAERAGPLGDGLYRCGHGRPGLYLIQTDGHGERDFHYWRSDSIARQLLQDDARCQRQSSYLAGFDWLYLSGITLAVIGLPAPDRFWDLLEHLRGQGLRLMFDPNWRPALWPDRDNARQACKRLLAQAAWAFPTLADETRLWNLKEPQAVLDWYQGLGVQEVVLKCPEALAVARAGGQQVELRSDYAGPVVDTSGAGDAFNAGYIAARLGGGDLGTALRHAHARAAGNVAHHGALDLRAGD